MKKWFSVETFFEGINLTISNIPSLWEQSILLIKAEKKEEIQTIAKKIAQKNEHEYEAMDGSIIRWVFKDIGNIFEIDSNSLDDGIEIFSRFLKDSQAKSLLTSFED